MQNNNKKKNWSTFSEPSKRQSSKHSGTRAAQMICNEFYFSFIENSSLDIYGVL